MQGYNTTPMREKYWHEKTADEKIDTLARHVNDLNQMLRYQQQRLDLLEAMTASFSIPAEAVRTMLRNDVAPGGYDYVRFSLGLASPEYYGIRPSSEEIAKAMQYTTAQTPEPTPG